jgi:hypothetical protein
VPQSLRARELIGGIRCLAAHPLSTIPQPCRSRGVAPATRMAFESPALEKRLIECSEQRFRLFGFVPRNINRHIHDVEDRHRVPTRAEFSQPCESCLQPAQFIF